MPKVDCPDCERHIAMHELEARTVTQGDGFSTNYRCPFCRGNIEDVGSLMV
ncbi:hypothetical protein SAMN06269185_2682 [Natronoarchaeum philippinense]|uniref:Small CPxCG-related zinc finger protein n=1 Tax=Natronoarchaeum philippinense TaxID=558529 RepID=A0A285P7D5_NATPI|nr:hypothetical protein SAMN06269185_2682 [Natronoarchaeum philippinense]